LVLVEIAVAFFVLRGESAVGAPKADTSQMSSYALADLLVVRLQFPISRRGFVGRAKERQRESGTPLDGILKLPAWFYYLRWQKVVSVG